MSNKFVISMLAVAVLASSAAYATDEKTPECLLAEQAYFTAMDTDLAASFDYRDAQANANDAQFNFESCMVGGGICQDEYDKMQEAFDKEETAYDARDAADKAMQDAHDAMEAAC